MCCSMFEQSPVFQEKPVYAQTQPVFCFFCRSIPSSSLPVTQQMTEMSISREEKALSLKAETVEPGNCN